MTTRILIPHRLKSERHMPESTETPYGEWPSPLTPEMIASSGVEYAGVALEDDAAWWLERRPAEEGRGVIVRQTANGETDITPSDYNVRTLVHEYGGGDFAVHDGTVWFANLDDQRLYRQQPGDDPEPITPVPDIERGDRYADITITPDGERLYCVRERHTEDGEPTNELVTVPVDGSNDPVVIASGHDFYSYPRIHPGGSRIAWTTWDHPSMPWDETTLHVAEIETDGTLRDSQSVLGDGESMSVFQPSWSPDGDLHAVSDQTGWWNLYRREDGEWVALYPTDAEFGVPQWVFDQSTYTFIEDGRIATVFGEQSTYRLGLLDPASGDLEVVDLPDDLFPRPLLDSDGERLFFVAASPTQPRSLVRWQPDEEAVVLDQATEIEIDAAYIAEPEHISYPTSGGETAHALYYPPQNPDVETPADELPPLIVQCHGGPTGETLPALSISAQRGKPPIQFFTTRGIAVVDVNYRGSTGYGRDYRDRLDGEWGILDTIDCVRAAEYLADQGRVDSTRLAIQGGSAGGYATLCALAFHDTFNAGVSYYGVADLEALARDTHKFESRYLDGLVGSLPEATETYRERSPVHHADEIRCPLLLLQGDEDPVVPPSQAEQMLNALAENGVPHSYIEFEGEQHGFQRADSIQRATEAELSFYGQLFDLTPSEDPESVEIIQPE
jgi:dipeptidyl aminopeptidase/acylaminoacyl peptidase